MFRKLVAVALFVSFIAMATSGLMMFFIFHSTGKNLRLQAEPLQPPPQSCYDSTVHILVSAPTHMSASQIMQKIKGRSSRVLQQEFPHLKKRYWGQHIWARGYFCTTVGQVTDQMIRDYIEGHVGKSPDDSFTVDED